jgi:hypothetical protein
MSDQIIQASSLDPSRCPSCKTPVPPEFADETTYTCEGCFRWVLHSGKISLPVASNTPMPFRVIQSVSPRWKPTQVIPKHSSLPTKSPKPNPETDVVSAPTDDGLSQTALEMLEALARASTNKDVRMSAEDLAQRLGVSLDAVKSNGSLLVKQGLAASKLGRYWITDNGRSRYAQTEPK